MNRTFRKRFIYFYLTYIFFVPVYYIYFLDIQDIEIGKSLAKSGGMHLNIFGGLTLTTIFTLLLTINLFSGKNSIKIQKLKEFKYLKYILYYLVAILAIDLFQYFYYNSDLLLVLKKPIPYINFPILLLNFFVLFDRNDVKKLYNYLIKVFIILFVLFTIFKAIPYFSNLSGINLKYRLEWFWYHSSNGTAAILAIIMIYFIYHYKFRSHQYINFWLILVSLTTIFIIFTFTRTIFFALLFSFILYLFIENRFKNFFIVSMIILLGIAFVDYTQVLNVFLRGQTDVFNINTAKGSTLAHRINTYFLPSIGYSFNNFTNLFLGSSYRGFNQFLYNLTGVNRANHNTFIQHLTTFGIISVLFYFLFWIRILWYSFKKLLLQKKFKNRNAVMATFFVILVYFIGLNFLNINTRPFENTMAITLFIHLKLLSNYHSTHEKNNFHNRRIKLS